MKSIVFGVLLAAVLGLAVYYMQLNPGSALTSVKERLPAGLQPFGLPAVGAVLGLLAGALIGGLGKKPKGDQKK